MYGNKSRRFKVNLSARYRILNSAHFWVLLAANECGCGDGIFSPVSIHAINRSHHEIHTQLFITYFTTILCVCSTRIWCHTEQCLPRRAQSQVIWLPAVCSTSKLYPKPSPSSKPNDRKKLFLFLHGSVVCGCVAQQWQSRQRQLFR